MANHISGSTKTIETKAFPIGKPRQHRWFSCVDLTNEPGWPWLYTNKYFNVWLSMVECTNQLKTCFPKQCGHTALTVGVWTRWLIDMVSVASGIFPVNFHTKWFLWNGPCAFRLRRLAQNGCRGISFLHFPFKFRHKMALVTCPCAFRLRRLAQNGCRGPGARHCLVNSRIKWLWWHVHVHFDCAGSHKTRHLIQKSCQETSYRELERPLMEILFRDLAKRPLTEILPTELL